MFLRLGKRVNDMVAGVRNEVTIYHLYKDGVENTKELQDREGLQFGNRCFRQSHNTFQIDEMRNFYLLLLTIWILSTCVE